MRIEGVGICNMATNNRRRGENTNQKRKEDKDKVKKEFEKMLEQAKKKYNLT